RADRAIAALVDLLAALAEPAGPGDDAGTNPLPEIAPAKRGRTLLPVAFAFAAVVAAVAALWLHGLVSWTSTHPPVSPAKATDVYISGSALRGKLVSAVRQELISRGLRVAVHWQHSALEPPGRVLSVRPTGEVPTGTLVVITGALAHGLPAPPSIQPGPGK